ncbi:hypothetical protein FVER53590_07665 [Fusarium verticillioides]|nr:hypothetical protein FVER14953_07665 [Fusarium verticillioides]RBR02537.1 hypothetical protein FVER53590_07665 [Fusarium verticillioides]
MVAIRSFFILSAAAGIASAGKCKPESRSSSIVPVASSTGSASVSVIESSTTLAGTTTETTLTKSATETASSETASASGSASATIVESSTTLPDTTVETSIAESTASSATSADISTTESKLTTFLTSFSTSNADTTTEAATTTTTEAATTTTAAAPPVDNCPPETGFCFGTAVLQCDIVMNEGLIFSGGGSLTQCAQICAIDDLCTGFSRRRSDGACYTSHNEGLTLTTQEGWDTGISYSCAT